MSPRRGRWLGGAARRWPCSVELFVARVVDHKDVKPAVGRRSDRVHHRVMVAFPKLNLVDRDDPVAVPDAGGLCVALHVPKEHWPVAQHLEAVPAGRRRRCGVGAGLLKTCPQRANTAARKRQARLRAWRGEVHRSRARHSPGAGPARLTAPRAACRPGPGGVWRRKRASSVGRSRCPRRLLREFSLRGLVLRAGVASGLGWSTW